MVRRRECSTDRHRVPHAATIRSALPGARSPGSTSWPGTSWRRGIRWRRSRGCALGRTAFVRAWTPAHGHVDGARLRRCGCSSASRWGAGRRARFRADLFVRTSSTRTSRRVRAFMTDSSLPDHDAVGSTRASAGATPVVARRRRTAGVGGPRTPPARAVSRVGPVYTPPEHRRRGYARPSRPLSPRRSSRTARSASSSTPMPRTRRRTRSTNGSATCTLLTGLHLRFVDASPVRHSSTIEDTSMALGKSPSRGPACLVWAVVLIGVGGGVRAADSSPPSALPVLLELPAALPAGTATSVALPTPARSACPRSAAPCADPGAGRPAGTPTCPPASASASPPATSVGSSTLLVAAAKAPHVRRSPNSRPSPAIGLGAPRPHSARRTAVEPRGAVHRPRAPGRP